MPSICLEMSSWHGPTTTTTEKCTKGQPEGCSMFEFLHWQVSKNWSRPTDTPFLPPLFFHAERFRASHCRSANWIVLVMAHDLCSQAVADDCQPGSSIWKLFTNLLRNRCQVLLHLLLFTLLLRFALLFTHQLTVSPRFIKKKVAALNFDMTIAHDGELMVAPWKEAATEFDKGPTIVHVTELWTL
jgi:hypothetical protein